MAEKLIDKQAESKAIDLERKQVLAEEAIVRVITEDPANAAPTLDEAWTWVDSQRQTGLLPVNVE